MTPQTFPGESRACVWTYADTENASLMSSARNTTIAGLYAYVRVTFSSRPSPVALSIALWCTANTCASERNRCDPRIRRRC